nr:G protein-coupled receptor [Proales similis]
MMLLNELLNSVRIVIWSLLAVVILFTALSNLVLCVVIFRERKLRTNTNFFLVSLACADFMVACFVMPLNLLVEVVGHFPLGRAVCTSWVLLDVLCCTSSIHHMSTMAVDRYLTIRFPFKYGRARSSRLTLLKIAFVWLVSIAICSPLLVIGIGDQEAIYRVKSRQCGLFDRNYRIYGSVLAFYVPFVLMLIAYAYTIRMLRKILKRKVRHNKQKLYESLQILQRKTFADIIEGILLQTNLTSLVNEEERCLNTERTGRATSGPARRVEKGRSHSLNDLPGQVRVFKIRKSLSSSFTVQMSDTDNFPIRNRANRATVPRTAQVRTQASSSWNEYENLRKVAYSERKALRVLMFIFGVFVALWAPFFVLNTVTALCKSCALSSELNSSVNTLLTWLGYLSSMANPIIYTMFNKTFRHGFLSVLTCAPASSETASTSRGSHTQRARRPAHIERKFTSPF